MLREIVSLHVHLYCKLHDSSLGNPCIGNARLCNASALIKLLLSFLVCFWILTHMLEVSPVVSVIQMSHSGSAEVVGQHSPVLTEAWLLRGLKKAICQGGDKPLNSRIICKWECWDQLFSCIYLELSLLQLVFITFQIICFCANIVPELRIAVRSPYKSCLFWQKWISCFSLSSHLTCYSPSPLGYTAEFLHRWLHQMKPESM